LNIDRCHFPFSGNAFANIYGRKEMEIHIGSQECPQTTQMGEQAGSQQAGDNTVFKRSGAAIHFIGMQRVDIPGGTNEQGYISLSNCAGESDFISEVGSSNGSFG
jgi:hypothetical protein